VQHSKIELLMPGLGQKFELPQRNGNDRFTSANGHNLRPERSRQKPKRKPRLLRWEISDKTMQSDFSFDADVRTVGMESLHKDPNIRAQVGSSSSKHLWQIGTD
jgi:hypothetical protein